MAASHERQLYTELLKTYQDLRTLWDTKSPEYNDMDQKALAWKELLAKYRQIDPEAGIGDVRKKVSCMRWAWIREFRKVLGARQRGEVHTPKLWYYKRLTFLEDVVDIGKSKIADSFTNPLEGASHMLEMSPSENDYGSDNSYLEETTDNRRIFIKNEIIGGSHQNEATSLLVPMAMNQHTNVTNINHSRECESFGAAIAEQLKGLELEQRMIAQKLISDTIFKARFKKLTFDSAVI